MGEWNDFAGQRPETIFAAAGRSGSMALARTRGGAVVQGDDGRRDGERVEDHGVAGGIAGVENVTVIVRFIACSFPDR